MQIKPLPPQPGHQERYRAVFSDIANYVQTMLATRTRMDANLVDHPSDANRVHIGRSQLRGHRRIPAEGMFCPTEIIPSQLRQG